MRKHALLFLYLTCSITVIAQPDTWVQKNDVGFTAPNGPTNRAQAVGFSIGNKGFIGTGNPISAEFNGATNDFFAYDPVANAWSKRANFGGGDRFAAVGFSIGSKGYIGTGADSLGRTKKDFWAYDSVTDTWSQKADFATSRSGAVGFSIGGKGYIGTGEDSTGQRIDFWQYDTAANTWTQKANFGGRKRLAAVGFSIGGRGFIGTGRDGSEGPMSYFNDFWEYDTAADTWTQKANCGNLLRAYGVGFSVGDKGYIGTGKNLTAPDWLDDFWQYDTAADTWTQKANFGGTPRYSATGFSTATHGYIGTGLNSSDNFTNDIWAYDPTMDSWTQQASFGGGTRALAVGFTIAGKGYIGMGSPLRSDFWEYDTASGSWTQKADFAGTPREYATAFGLGSKGYVGTGETAGVFLNDFWQFDPVANSWTQKASLGGPTRDGATGFSIGGKGYIAMGANESIFYNDLWEYDTLADSWTQKANFGGTARQYAVAFSIGSEGYLGTGYLASPDPVTGYAGEDFWQYDQASDTWTQKASLTNASRGATGFSLDGLGYILAGPGGNFWQYNPGTDSWTQKTNFGGGSRGSAVGFSIGDAGYIGTGQGNNGLTSDFWQYNTTATVRTSIGDYWPVSGCSSPSGSSPNWELDNNSSLVFGINPNSNTLGATCWGIRIVSGSYRDATAFFGGPTAQTGAYLPRNYVVSPGTEPGSAVTLRLYCATQELTAFIDYFNTTYGTSYTQSDIRILRYDGVNQDLDPANNSGTATDYASITPTTIGTYGGSGEYQYLEFSSSGLSEFAIVLTSTPVAPLPLKLLDFTAAYANGATTLRWQTAQEDRKSVV